MNAHPSRTHVLAVGVSTYAIGIDWHLPNAATHAVAFAEWAHAAGVPAEHIHLFLSQADYGCVPPHIREAGVVPKPATREALNNFVDHQLTELAGDVLYFFWAGHGSIGHTDSHLLFFEEQPNRPYVQFDFDHFLAKLRTEDYGFPLQVGYVDVCANRFETLGFKGAVGVSQSGLSPLKSVRQMYFLAADSGQQAIAGEFSTAVLSELGRPGGGNEWPVDHNAIVERVRAQFEPTDEYPARQRPVQIVWVTREGDRVTTAGVQGDLPAESFVNVVADGCGLPVGSLRRLARIAADNPALQEPDARNRLYERLAKEARVTSPEPRGSRMEQPDLDLLYIIASAFFWHSPTDTPTVIEALSGEVSRSGASAAGFVRELRRVLLVADVRRFLRGLSLDPGGLHAAYLMTIDRFVREPGQERANSLLEMLDELTQRMSHDESFRYVWEFLLRVADWSPNDRAELDRFVRDHARDQSLVDAIRKQLQAGERYLLSIVINPGDDAAEAPGNVSAQLFVAGTMEPIKLKNPDWPGTDNWERVKDAVVSVVQEARKLVFKRAPTAADVSDRLDIEFAMPHPFFSMAPDRFGIPLPLSPKPLGLVHPVVVRWLYRLSRPWDTEEKPWKEIAAKIDPGQPGTVSWIRAGCGCTPDAGPAGCGGLVALEFVPGVAGEIEDLLAAGFPFIAWLRNQPADGSWETFRTAFERCVAQTSKFGELPRAFPRIRGTERSFGQDLTLFWDDPRIAGHWMCYEPGVKG